MFAASRRENHFHAQPPGISPAAERPRRGDECGEAALVALNLTFRSALLRFIQRRTADPLEAEDMVQEVFERLLRRGDVGGLGNLKSYAFETAANVLKDRARRRRARFADAHQAFDGDQHGGVEVSPEHVFLFREHLRRTEATLSELPERTRAIFLLRRLQGARHGDIATQFGISVSAVEKHMSRAVAHLRANMLMAEVG